MMNDIDFQKILKHAPLDWVGPATVSMLVARGCRREGLAQMISMLMHRVIDEGAADAGVSVMDLTMIYQQQSSVAKH